MTTIDSIKLFKSRYDDLVFYFSTEKNRSKFDSKIIDYLPLMQSMLQKRFDIDFINPKDFLYISLYRTVEKGIFKIEHYDKNGKLDYSVSPNLTASINLNNYKEKKHVNQVG